ncbi:MAG: protein phosphatase 2C domain-containing protein [Anaerolineae bacterium]|jgi:serine/threonine protein phosphatase PrpC|nr:protein phosphatase 2C domain-containing protein [Anaerolineae bacterium]
MTDTAPLPQRDPQLDIGTAPMRPTERIGSDEHTHELTKVVPRPPVAPHTNAHLAYGQSSDVGMIRSNNQDSNYVFVSASRSGDAFPQFGIFMVADGMGGHSDGELASATVVRVSASNLLQKVYLPIINKTDISDRVPMSEALDEAFQAAHRVLIEDVPTGGTTLTAAVLMGNLAHVAHVGDSRIYLVNEEKIEKLSRDHSYVQRLIELNELDPSQAENHPQKSVLYRALGLSEQLDVDVMTRRVSSGSYLLICSDGLWGLVSDEELRSITLRYPPQQACDTLVSLANQRGGTDNITVVIVYIP